MWQNHPSRRLWVSDCFLHFKRWLRFDDDLIWWWFDDHLTREFQGKILWAHVSAVVESFSWLGYRESSAWKWVLPGWISRYLPGSNRQSGYPKCLAEIPPGYKSLLLKCLTFSFQQRAVQSFPDSCDILSHTYMKITQWHFSATLFTRWYKYKNISSHLTFWCFSLCIEHFREARRRKWKGRIRLMSWHVNTDLHIFSCQFSIAPCTWSNMVSCISSS